MCGKWSKYGQLFSRGLLILTSGNIKMNTEFQEEIEGTSPPTSLLQIQKGLFGKPRPPHSIGSIIGTDR